MLLRRCLPPCSRFGAFERCYEVAFRASFSLPLGSTIDHVHLSVIRRHKSTNAGFSLPSRSPSLCGGCLSPSTLRSSPHRPTHTSSRGGSTSERQQLFIGSARIRIRTADEADTLTTYLSPNERRCLLKSLQGRAAGAAETDDDTASSDDEDSKSPVAIARAQLWMLYWVNFFPFIGFGFLDNFVMIIAGEYIDVTIGVLFSISTMAAAALGNIISDIAGIGLAHYVEAFVHRFGIRVPTLTRRQFESPRARLSVNMGRILGLTVGCLIGMFPLLFFDESTKIDLKKTESKPQAAAESGLE